ncbi:MAG TPA: ScpA family protein [Stellaceae bacterium]
MSFADDHRAGDRPGDRAGDRARLGEEPALVLDLDGYEGPIDLLLASAREQKVDLAKLSILALADQYLAFIAAQRHLRLEIAADYLVMAAWLAYLKSRLLLPEPPGEDEGPSAEELAASLGHRLRLLAAMQRAGAALMSGPQLGRDVFARGMPEGLPRVDRPVYELTLYELLSTYGEGHRRSHARVLTIELPTFHSLDEALHHLARFVGHVPEWRDLLAFLPEELRGALYRRSALAATFAATLELTRAGRVELRQDRAFGPIYLRSTAARRGDAG